VNLAVKGLVIMMWKMSGRGAGAGGAALLGRRWCAAMLLLAAGLAGGGCEVNVTPPPEAVLAGTWVLTGEQISTFIDKALVFNSSGRLTQVTTRSTNIFGAEQRVVERDLNLPTTVSGNSVRVVLTADLVFEGTFNAAMNEANGQLQTETSFFNTTVITDQGPGKIVRQ
jgi:hypothetical protein